MEKSLPKMGKKQAREAWLFAIKTFIQSAKQIHDGQSDEWYKVGLIAKGALEDGVSLSYLALLAGEIECEELERAVRTTQKIRMLGSDLGVSKADLFQMALYIETCLSHVHDHFDNYLSRRKSKFARTIEYDPHTHKAYIHLKNHKTDILGHGFKKTVTKSVLYDHHKPEIIARCESKLPMPEEIEALKEMQGSKGIVQVYSFTERSLKDNGKSFNIMCKLYQGGTLSQAMQRHTKFTLKQKMKIAHDLLTGLEALHAKGFVHRDVTARNMLLDYQKKGKRKVKGLSAVISDLGRTIPAKSAFAVAAQANSAYVPPEGLLYEKLMNEDYYQSDIFALGCVLHHLYTGKSNPWVDKVNVRNLTKPVSVRQAKLTYDLQRYRKKRLAKLLSKNKRRLEASLEDRFERLTLKMIDPNPKNRGSAKELRKMVRDMVLASNAKGGKKESHVSVDTYSTEVQAPVSAPTQGSTPTDTQFRESGSVVDHSSV